MDLLCFFLAQLLCISICVDSHHAKFIQFIDNHWGKKFDFLIKFLESNCNFNYPIELFENWLYFHGSKPIEPRSSQWILLYKQDKKKKQKLHLTQESLAFTDECDVFLGIFLRTKENKTHNFALNRFRVKWWSVKRISQLV